MKISNIKGLSVQDPVPKIGPVFSNLASKKALIDREAQMDTNNAKARLRWNNKNTCLTLAITFPLMGLVDSTHWKKRNHKSRELSINNNEIEIKNVRKKCYETTWHKKTKTQNS